MTIEVKTITVYIVIAFVVIVILLCRRWHKKKQRQCNEQEQRRKQAERAAEYREKEEAERRKEAMRTREALKCQMKTLPIITQNVPQEAQKWASYVLSCVKYSRYVEETYRIEIWDDCLNMNGTLIRYATYGLKNVSNRDTSSVLRDAVGEVFEKAFREEMDQHCGSYYLTRQSNYGISILGEDITCIIGSRSDW